MHHADKNVCNATGNTTTSASAAAPMLRDCVQITAITLKLRIKTPHHMMAPEGYGALYFRPTEYIVLLALLCYRSLTFRLKYNVTVIPLDIKKNWDISALQIQ